VGSNPTPRTYYVEKAGGFVQRLAHKHFRVKLGEGKINMMDIGTVARHFGEHYL